MSAEENFIDLCKRINPELFAAESVKINPGSMESLARAAFKAGQQSHPTLTGLVSALDSVLNQKKT